MRVELSFDMPFSLNIEGNFLVKIDRESFSVSLTTHNEENPDFPHAESVNNISIIDDDTKILSHTKVHAKFNPLEKGKYADENLFFAEIEKLAISLANILISGARHVFGDYFLDYVYHEKRLGVINFTFARDGQFGTSSGIYDSLMGGITTRVPPRSGAEALEFSRFLCGDLKATVAQDLYLDARRYLAQKNARMALANLVISFETGLADRFLDFVANRNDPDLEKDISRSTLSRLGEHYAKILLGHSFGEDGYWGSSFTGTFAYIRSARNNVLHKAIMKIQVNCSERDLSDLSELNELFKDRDLFMDKLDIIMCSSIEGKSNA